MDFAKTAAKWIAAIALAGFGATGAPGRSAPFEGAKDGDYANRLWAAIKAINLAGADAINTVLGSKRFLPRPRLTDIPGNPWYYTKGSNL